ncbi:alpha/beta fold hydrolase [Actinorhabdospora filicis]|nr:alpha/beta fold hydrolase [Actinorhabdospora filicis]
MTIIHDVAGDGPAVTLLHSGVCDRRMWQAQWQPLVDAGFKAIRVDFRGYGDTPYPTEPWNNADDVRDLLDELGIEKTAVVGSSWGGRIAQEFAARYPERVSRLVLLCAAGDLAEPTPDVIAFDDREEALIEAGDLDGAVALNVATWVGPLASAETRELVTAMQRRAFDVQVGGADVAPIRHEYSPADIAAPTLVVKGAHDLELFQNLADAFVAVLPDARLLDLDWAGHLPTLEAPERVEGELIGFLRG